MLLLFAFWLLCDFFLLSGVTKDSSASSFFIFLQGAIDRLFLATTWEMYPLRFQVQISRIQRQNKFSSSSFSDVGDWSKITCKWTNQIFSFSRTFWYLETGQEIHLLPLRVPHRHIRFCLFHESSNMAHEIHFPTEFSSNPNQTHPSMLIKFFRIFRKPQVGELDQGWS